MFMPDTTENRATFEGKELLLAEIYKISNIKIVFKEVGDSNEKHFYPNDGGLNEPVRDYRDYKNSVFDIALEHFKKKDVSKDK